LFWVHPGFVQVLSGFLVNSGSSGKPGGIREKPGRTRNNPELLFKNSTKNIPGFFRVLWNFHEFRVFAVKLEKAGKTRSDSDKTRTKPGRTWNYPEGFVGRVHILVVPHSPV
jgi:hypothetical protein